MDSYVRRVTKYTNILLYFYRQNGDIPQRTGNNDCFQLQEEKEENGDGVEGMGDQGNK